MSGRKVYRQKRDEELIKEIEEKYGICNKAILKQYKSWLNSMSIDSLLERVSLLSEITELSKEDIKLKTWVKENADLLRK